MQKIYEYIDYIGQYSLSYNESEILNSSWSKLNNEGIDTLIKFIREFNKKGTYINNKDGFIKFMVNFSSTDRYTQKKDIVLVESYDGKLIEEQLENTFVTDKKNNGLKKENKKSKFLFNKAVTIIKNVFRKIIDKPKEESKITKQENTRKYKFVSLVSTKLKFEDFDKPKKNNELQDDSEKFAYYTQVAIEIDEKIINLEKELKEKEELLYLNFILDNNCIIYDDVNAEKTVEDIYLLKEYRRLLIKLKKDCLLRKKRLYEKYEESTVKMYNAYHELQTENKMKL